MKKIAILFILISSLCSAQRGGFQMPLCNQMYTYIEGDGSMLDPVSIYTLNDMVQNLLNDTLWSKLDVLYFFAQASTGSGVGAVRNLIAPQSHICTTTGSVTFTAYQGYKGNATNASINTNFNASTAGVNFTLNSGCHGAYVRTNPDGAANEVAAGAVSTTGALSYNTIYPKFTSNNALVDCNITDADFGATKFAESTGTGLFVAQVISSTQGQSFKNGVLQVTATTAQSYVPNLNDYVLAKNNNGTAGTWFNGQVSIRFYAGKLNTWSQIRLSADFNRAMSLLGTNVY